MNMKLVETFRNLLILQNEAHEESPPSYIEDEDLTALDRCHRKNAPLLDQQIGKLLDTTGNEGREALARASCLLPW